MEQPNRAILNQFDVQSMPDLDVAVLGALELFSGAQLPTLDFSHFKRPLVVGSEGASTIGKILFDEMDAVFANESDYEKELEDIPSVDGAILVSASGGKHAVSIAENLKEKSIETWLLTNNENALAKQFIPNERVIVFPKNREPYTYNTSTYLGMVLSKTKENPKDLYSFLMKKVLPLIPDNFSSFGAFYLMVPGHLHFAKSLLTTKFDELLEPKISGRAFSFKQTEHAKTIVSSSSELFISFGEQNETFGTKETRLFIPLPKKAHYGAMIAIGYFVIGHIQKQNPPYFKENIVAYAKKASDLFNQPINPIVE